MDKVTVETRVPLELLAPIAEWLIVNQDRPASQSDLISKCVETLYRILITNDEITPVESYADALITLNGIGLFIKRTSRRDKKVMRNLSLENIRRESSLSHEAEAREMARIANELVKKRGIHTEEDNSELHKEQLKEARRSAIPDPGAIAGPRPGMTIDDTDGE